MNILVINSILSRVRVFYQEGVGVNKVSDLKSGDLLLLNSLADENESIERVFLLLKPVNQETLILEGRFVGSKTAIEFYDLVQLATKPNVHLLARQADRAFFQLVQLFEKRGKIMEKLARIESRVTKFTENLLN